MNLLSKRKRFNDGLGTNFWDQDETTLMLFNLGIYCMGGDGGGDSGGDSTVDDGDTGDTGVAADVANADAMSDVDDEDSMAGGIASGNPNPASDPSGMAGLAAEAGRAGKGNANAIAASDALNDLDSAVNEEARHQAGLEAARKAGYTNHKGVFSVDPVTGKKTAVTSGSGSMARSSGYVSAYESGYNQKANEQIAQQNYDKFMAVQEQNKNALMTGSGNLPTQFQVPSDLIAISKGQNPYGSRPPTQAEIDMARTQIGEIVGQQMADIGMPVGLSMDPNDPMGIYGAPTIGGFGFDEFGNMVMMDVGFTNAKGIQGMVPADPTGIYGSIRGGFNTSGGFLGTQMTNDSRGNVGFSDFGMRVADTVGPMVASTVLGGMLGPIGGLIGSSINPTTMQGYGNYIGSLDNEYASQGTQEISFSPMNSILGKISGMAGGAVSEKVAIDAIKGGSSINAAINKGLLAGMGTQVGVNYAGKSVLGDMGSLGFTTSSALPSEAQMASDVEGGSGGGGADGTESNVLTQFSQSVAGTGPQGDRDQTINSAGSRAIKNVGGDITNPQNVTLTNPITTTEVSGEPRADYLGPAITGLPAGVKTSVSENIFNPIMEMDKSTGVQYLRRGRNRDYGSDTTSKVSKVDFQRGNRRSKISGGTFGKRAKDPVYFI